MLPTKETGRIAAHQGAILALTFNSDGQYVLSAGHDKVVRLWNLAKRSVVKDYAGTHGYEIADLACAPDNSRFLSAGRDRAVFLTDVATGRVLRRFSKHDHRINCVAFNEDATVALSGAYDRTLCAWDLRAQTRDPIFVFEDANDSVTRVAVTPSEIVTASVDGCARTYDLRAGRVTIDHMGDPITSLMISGDNNCLLASVLISAVRLLDRSNGEMLNEYHADGHRNQEFQLDSRLTRDDGAVVSGSEDGAIRYWDLVSGDLLRKLPGHAGPVTRLAIHPTKDELVSAGFDGTIRIWS